MMGHKICFYGQIRLIIPKLSLLPLLIWSTGLSGRATVLLLQFSFLPTFSKQANSMMYIYLKAILLTEMSLFTQAVQSSDFRTLRVPFFSL